MSTPLDPLDSSDDRNVQALARRMWAAIVSYVAATPFEVVLTSTETPQPTEAMREFLDNFARDVLAQADADRAADLWGVN